MIKFHPKYKYEESHGWAVSQSSGTMNGDDIRLERIDEANAFEDDTAAMRYVCNMAEYLFSQGDVENNYMYALKTLFVNKDLTHDYNIALTLMNGNRGLAIEIQSYKGDDDAC